MDGANGEEGDSFVRPRPEVAATVGAPFKGTALSPTDPAVRASLMRQAAAVVQSVAPNAENARRKSNNQLPAGFWTKNGRQLVIAHGWMESYLGGAGSFAPGGVPSWNWGAVVCKTGQSCLAHPDHTADGVLFESHFGEFPSMEDGFRNYLATGSFNAHALAAAQQGDAYGMAEALYRAGYYGGTEGSDEDRIAAYAGALLGASKSVAAALGEPLMVSLHGGGDVVPLAPSRSGSRSAARIIAAVAALGAAVYYAWRWW